MVSWPLIPSHWILIDSPRYFFQQLTQLTNVPPVARNREKKNDAGRFAARLFREIDSLWLFLEESGVSPTNNHAERMLRYAVCWRKRSYGNVSDKGLRWTERILSVRQTCRLKTKRTFPVLVHAIDSYFKGVTPDLAWIAEP